MNAVLVFNCEKDLTLSLIGGMKNANIMASRKRRNKTIW
jgi:hypothetical protein